MIIWRGSWVGKIPSANRRIAARAVRGRAIMYPSTEYKQAKQSMINTFFPTAEHISQPVDALLRVSLWKMRDSDNAVKIVLDALEKAGVLESDRQVRDIAIRREYHKRDEADRVDIVLVSTEAEAVVKAWQGVK